MDPVLMGRLAIILACETPVALGIYLMGMSLGWPLWLIVLLCCILGAGVGEAMREWFYRD